MDFDYDREYFDQLQYMHMNGVLFQSCSDCGNISQGFAVSQISIISFFYVSDWLFGLFGNRKPVFHHIA